LAEEEFNLLNSLLDVSRRKLLLIKNFLFRRRRQEKGATSQMQVAKVLKPLRLERKKKDEKPK
jgi:hypothetical protein